MSVAATRLRPSQASSWVSCPGFARASHLFSSAPSPEQLLKIDAGLRCHDLAEAMLEGRRKTYDDDDSDLVEIAETYRDVVESYRTPTSTILIESKIKTSAGGVELTGRADAVVVDRESVACFELKTGKFPVSPFKNPQLLIYLRYFFDKYPTIEQFILVVVQPNGYSPSGPVKTWQCDRDEFQSIWGKIDSAARSAASATPILNPGRACKFCPGAFCCPALRDNTRELEERSQLLERWDRATPEYLSSELELATAQKHALEARINGLESFIFKKLESGETVPGFGITEKTGRVSYRDPQQVIEIGDALGVDLRKPPQPLSITESKKLLKKFNLPVEALRSLIGPGKTTMSLERLNHEKLSHIFNKKD